VSTDFASFEEFQRAAAGRELVATAVTMAFDHETPVALAERWLGEEGFFLLESASAGPGSVARWSFLGFSPLASVTLSGATLTRRRGDKTTSTRAPSSNPTVILRAFMGEFSIGCAKAPERGPDVIAMCGGVGWLTWDAVTGVEPSVVPPSGWPPAKLGTPQLFWQIPRNFLIYDQLTRKLTVVRLSDVRPLGADFDESALKSLWVEERRAFDAVMHALERPWKTQPLRTRDDPIAWENFTGTVTKDKFLEMAAQSLEEIRAGEIFQIQIGNRLSCHTPARPFDIFRHLRSLNPSPYMFYFAGQNEVILGASPEMMVSVEGARIVQRPIAGTRRRSWKADADQRMRQELVTSEKERAEHVMLVDLARNDIGRVARPGTVRVEELMVVEEYSHVFHMVSQVCGERRGDLDCWDVLQASFPNGTVCGAPKIRAIQIISSLEPVTREFYAGTLGLATFGGDLKTTILIRSIHWKDGVASTHASAGIVHDSIPEQEWLETRNKMAACLTVMQNTL
jgi:anthranilate synthase component 1